MKKKLLVLVLTFVMLFAFSVECFASSNEENGIAPCYTNTNSYSFSFNVYDPGVAEVDCSYYGNSNTFTQAKLTVKIEKKFLLLFWKTVDIGEPNDEWVAYNTNLNGNFYKTFTVDGTGTYRATYTLEIFGNSGVTDVIEDEREFKYE